jgi:RNA polymerase sigma-70 factor (ECF subfamily)
MSDPNTFGDFIQRIRAGDEQAATELVRKYEPLIRREIRLQMEDPRLKRVLDSVDVCQSVLASFFVRATAGQFDLDRPDKLIRLLVTMARNKLASVARGQRRQRRDVRRNTAGNTEELNRVAGDEPTPSEFVAGKELLLRFRQGLSEEERQLADLRAQGVAWADIAAKLGGSPQGRRMQLTRAVERVAKELGLEVDAHE